VIAAVICLFSIGGIKLVQSSSASTTHLGNNGSAEQERYITSASSDGVLVNKHRKLQPSTYTPAKLFTPAVPLRLDAEDEEMKVTPATAKALEALFADAGQQSVSLMFSSGFRSYESQQKLYEYYISIQGKAEADKQSARPGYSEHQTGLGVDIAPADGTCNAQPCFAALPEGRWLAANAHKYGFIIRYPDGKSKITGYIYEPWHLRYVGSELAATLYTSGLTLEEHFKTGPAPTYK
jgi:D-alanyl-D-alanine carboxypeptidase